MLKLIQYPHPTLRHVSKPLKRVDAELAQYVRQMFDVMYESQGVGLAANQVDLPYRVFVVNLKSDAKAKNHEQVFINPVIRGPKGMDEAEEGCLSLPGLFCPVKRPEKVTIQAYNLAGELVGGNVSGLLARVVQHELDHLDGVLFTDRLSPVNELAVREALSEFETVYQARRSRGELREEVEIAARLKQLEELRR